MIKNTKVEITIRDNVSGLYLIMPVTPEVIAFKDGSKQSEAVDILNLGTVEIPAGVDLDTFGWESFFPARYDPSYCVTPTILKPQEYRDRLRKWKNAGTALQLVCPAAGLNNTMYLADFSGELEGFELDMNYSVEFRQLKTLRPQKLTPGGTVPAKGKKAPADRPPAATSSTPAKTHKVVSGDTLSGIAKKYKIADWKTILDKNKGLIKDPHKLTVGWVLKL